MIRGSTKRKQQKAALALLENPDQMEAELCRRDFSFFIKAFWGEITSDDLSWNWHIDYLAEQLTNVALRVAEWKPRENDLIINIPPGTTKSITCSVMFPVWCWINWYWMSFITSSYSKDLSLEHAQLSRDIVRSEKFKRLFPELSIKVDKDVKSNFRMVLTEEDGTIKFGGNRFSTSVGGSLTGYHGHILIVDDPLDPNGAASRVEIDKANHWMSQTLSTRKKDKEVTTTILIMQRLHEEDPTGYMLEKKKNIFHICLPGQIHDYKEEVSPQELVKYYINGLLDPKRLSQVALDDLMAALGEYGFSGQIGQNPIPPGGGMFHVDMLKILEQPPNPIHIEQTFRYWDKAGTAGGNGAFTAGVKIHKLKNLSYIIADVVRGRWGTDEREAIIKATAIADGRDVVIYMEQEPGSGGKDSVLASIKNLAGFAVYADRPTGDKVTRAAPFSVQVNIGNVYMLHGEWNADFKNEARHFPLGKFKDQIDAGAGAFNQLSQKRQAGVF